MGCMEWVGSTFINDLGTMQEIFDIPYGIGRQRLEEIGADFSKMTPRNMAFARIQLGTDHYFNQDGNWVVAEIIDNLNGFENPILFLGQGPVYNDPEAATIAHKKLFNRLMFTTSRVPLNSVLFIPENLKEYGDKWEEIIINLTKLEAEALENEKINPLEMHTFELPRDTALTIPPGNKFFMIPVDELITIETEKLSDPSYFNKISKEAQVAAVLFKDQTQSYAEKVLKKAGAKGIQFSMLSKKHSKKRKEAVSEPLWMGGLGGTLSMCGYLDYGNMRGIIG